MTDKALNFDSLQERNQQILNYISELQKQEKQLYDSLDNVNLSPDQKREIINKINQISQTRINMYSGLKDMYSFYQRDVSASGTTLVQQMAAVDILENELNDAKIRLNLLQDEKNNTLRLVQINTYYGKRYNAHSRLMKIIVIMCIPLIILAVLANKGILPPNLYVFTSGLIIVIGLVVIGYQLIDISNRSNMNWDEYNWHFDRENAETTTADATTSGNPWGSVSLTCIGSACCYEGTTYDETNNICVPNEICQNNKETTESFRGLDRYAYTQVKPINLNPAISPIYAHL